MRAFAGVFARAEIVHWWASRRRLGSEVESAPRSEAVVVLGFENRGERANYLNRYRVRAWLQSLDPNATESVLIFCCGDVPAAELMARYAPSGATA